MKFSRVGQSDNFFTQKLGPFRRGTFLRANPFEILRGWAKWANCHNPVHRTSFFDGRWSSADLPTVQRPQRPLRSAESAHRRGFGWQGVLGPQPESSHVGRIRPSAGVWGAGILAQWMVYMSRVFIRSWGYHFVVAMVIHRHIGTHRQSSKKGVRWPKLNCQCIDSVHCSTVYAIHWRYTASVLIVYTVLIVLFNTLAVYLQCIAYTVEQYTLSVHWQCISSVSHTLQNSVHYQYTGSVSPVYTVNPVYLICISRS